MSALDELSFLIHGVKLTLFCQGGPTVCLSVNSCKDIAKEHVRTSSYCSDSSVRVWPVLLLKCASPLDASSPEAGFCVTLGLLLHISGD